MKSTIRVVHGSTESTYVADPDDWQTTQFLLAKAYEWVQGRRDGHFTAVTGRGSMTVQFADITFFSVEVQA